MNIPSMWFNLNQHAWVTHLNKMFVPFHNYFKSVPSWNKTSKHCNFKWDTLGQQMGIKLAVGKLLIVNLQMCCIYKVPYFHVRLWGKDSVLNKHIFMALKADIEERAHVKNEVFSFFILNCYQILELNYLILKCQSWLDSLTIV